MMMRWMLLALVALVLAPGVAVAAPPKPFYIDGVECGVFRETKDRVTLEACGRFSAPTPVPTPVATPTPAPADCPQGELPKLNKPGFETWYGRESVPIGPGDVHVWCFTLTQDVHKLEFAVGDKTGAAQCFWHTAEYLPPKGAVTVRPPGPQSGRDTSYAFLNTVQLLPKGTWRIKVTAEHHPPCVARYQVVGHP